MTAISSANLVLFVVATAFQLGGALLLLPATRGMTSPIPSAAVFVCYAIGLIAMSRLIVARIGLSMLIPIMTVAILLSAIAFGTMVYGDSISAPKLLFLVGAAMMIGAASRY